ncbi:MAG: prenyltransferase, partial [Phototrophicaceae bacterium]
LMAGWSWTPALALWLALAIKAVTTVLYVRSRLRLERGKAAAEVAAVGAHGVGLAVLVGAWLAGWLPWTAPLAMALLTIRAGVGPSPLRKPRPPKVIGFQEMGYSLAFVALIALGF